MCLVTLCGKNGCAQWLDECESLKQTTFHVAAHLCESEVNM